METISIGFSYHKSNFLSKIIRNVENSDYSHVYIRRKSKYGEYVYQASGLAVNFMNINVFLSENEIIEEYEFHLEENQKNKVLEFFIKYAGYKYEISALFKLIWIISTKRLGINIKLKGESDKFICSELSALFCEEILNIRINDNLDFITPKSLNPFIKEYGKRII